MTATIRDLVDELDRGGYLTDPAWRAAFQTVPREAFVPWFFVPAGDRPGWLLAEGDDRWTHGLYRDEVLVTQIGGDDSALAAARAGQAVVGEPTSSSSAPSLMAAMLHALDVRDGARVLEVGTGAGYNACLLAQRLGDEPVTSLDVDPGLVERARAAAAGLGHHPRLLVGDGAAGHPGHAPYDRILATVAFDRVPAALPGQLADDGMLLLPMTFAGHGGLMALLHRTADGVTGRFLDQYGGFMPTRGTPQAPEPPHLDTALWAHARRTPVPPEAVRDGHPASFFLSMCCPTTYATLGFRPTGEEAEQTWGYGADGSVFALRHTDDHIDVAADGPLWASLEDAYLRWHDLGQPTRDRFGLTATGERQWAWLDDPHGPHTWPRPT